MHPAGLQFCKGVEGFFPTFVRWQIKRINMKNWLFILITVALALNSWSCKPKSKETSAPQAQGNTLPTLPIENLRTLVSECNHIDFIMYNPSFSMSTDEASSVRSTLQQISDAPATHAQRNQPIGRIFYQAGTETLLEADIYIGAGGDYFLFYQDKKPAYANAMTPQGRAYYDQILSQVRGAIPQQ